MKEGATAFHIFNDEYQYIGTKEKHWTRAMMRERESRPYASELKRSAVAFISSSVRFSVFCKELSFYIEQ